MKNRPILHALGLAAALAFGTAHAVEFSDPRGDDKGPGNYTYATDPVYKAGDVRLAMSEILAVQGRKKFIRKGNTWIPAEPVKPYQGPVRMRRAEFILHRPEITLEWVRESLQLAAGSGDMTIQLSPADQSTLKKQVQQIANVFAPLANVNVTASEAVAPGGCRVVTEFGVIDQQIETQIARIKEELS